MSDRALERAAGIAAVTGGVLRIVNSFAGGWLGARAMGLVFFVEDFLLLVGLLGIWLSQRRRLGGWGAVGVKLGLLGLFTLRSQSLFGAVGYQLGAAELLVGVCLIGVRLFGAGQRAAASLWFAALALGLLSLVPALARPCAFAAALAFGLGFALAGLPLVRARG